MECSCFPRLIRPNRRRSPPLSITSAAPRRSTRAANVSGLGESGEENSCIPRLNRGKVNQRLRREPKSIRCTGSPAKLYEKLRKRHDEPKLSANGDEPGHDAGGSVNFTHRVFIHGGRPKAAAELANVQSLLSRFNPRSFDNQCKFQFRAHVYPLISRGGDACGPGRVSVIASRHPLAGSAKVRCALGASR